MDGTSPVRRSGRSIAWILPLAVVVGSAALFVGLSFKFLRNCPESNWGRCYVRAALRLQAGERICRPEPDAYAYPPTMAMLILPLANLPAAPRDVIWYLLNVAAMVATVMAAWHLVGAPTLLQAAWWWYAVFWLGLGLSLRFLLAPLDNTQFDMILVALLLCGCCRLWGGAQVSGGALVGAAAAMKCTPLLFLPYLLWRRQWHAAGVMLATVLLLWSLPDLGWPDRSGVPHLVTWYRTFLAPVAEFVPGQWHTGSRIELNQSLGSLLQRWAAYGWPLSMDQATQSVSPSNLTGVLRPLHYGIAALLLLLTALRLGRPGRLLETVAAGSPRPLAWSALRFPLEAAMGMCLMLLLSPMSSKAHYVVMILPALLLARRTIEYPTRGMILVTVALAILGPLSSKGPLGTTIGNLTLFWGFPTLFVLVGWASLGWLHRVATPREPHRAKHAVPRPHQPRTAVGCDRTASSL